MRLGKPLNKHTCEHGDASSMWARRSRRTLLKVNSTPHLFGDHPAMLHALIFAPQTFPVGCGAKNFGAKPAVPFGFEGAVINGLRLGNFAVRPRADFFRTRQTDANGVEVRD